MSYKSILKRCDLFIYIYIYIYMYFIYICIVLVGRVFANGPGDWGSIQGQVITKTQKMIPPCLTLSIIRYVSRVSGAIQGKEWHSLLHLSVVTIEKGAFELPLITVVNFFYCYIYIYIYIYGSTQPLHHR